MHSLFSDNQKSIHRSVSQPLLQEEEVKIQEALLQPQQAAPQGATQQGIPQLPNPLQALTQ